MHIPAKHKNSRTRQIKKITKVGFMRVLLIEGKKNPRINRGSEGESAGITYE
jgi:hypothetical protein